METCFEQVLPKKMTELIKMQITGEKQQFIWTNKMVDDLSRSLENVKALLEFEGKYFDRDRQAQ